MQSLDFCENTIALAPFGDKWRAFGWNVIETDGAMIPMRWKPPSHRLRPMRLREAHRYIANIIKGKGVSFMENNILWHYRTPQGEEYEAALKELEAQRP